MRRDLQRDNREAETAPLGVHPAHEQLYDRRERPPDYEIENRTLASLVPALADSPWRFFRPRRQGSGGAPSTHCRSSLWTKNSERFYGLPLSACGHRAGAAVRRWTFVPGGDVLDLNGPLLFTHLDRAPAESICN